MFLVFPYYVTYVRSTHRIISPPPILPPPAHPCDALLNLMPVERKYFLHPVMTSSPDEAQRSPSNGRHQTGPIDVPVLTTPIRE